MCRGSTYTGQRGAARPAGVSQKWQFSAGCTQAGRFEPSPMRKPAGRGSRRHAATALARDGLQSVSG